MIKSRHTDEEKQQCVNEYLNGKNKYYLAGKYSTSIRSIDRWISKMDINEVELRKRRRADCIDIDIQEEILKSLNTNPIIKGFKISQWNETSIIKYIKDTYNIDINRRMAKSLIEDSVKLNDISYEDKVYNDIEELSVLGYNIILVDYIRIGRISSKELEYLELREYTTEKLDVNLVILRSAEYMYLDVIVSEAKITSKSPKIDIRELSKKINNNDDYEITIEKIKKQRKEIVNDKCNIFDKILKKELNKKIVFITKYDDDIKKIITRKNQFKFYIVEDTLYNDLRQIDYEGEYAETAIYYMNDENNNRKVFGNIRDISDLIKGKIERYVLNVTIDNYKIENCIKDIDKNSSIIQKNKERVRKRVKYLKSYFIYNI
ncbi:MAG: hypothetical protein SPH93_08280 [Clostridium sp.]|jgi:hypothetical protein|uniref:hypothetical protein n=1 Tax=Clostridium sp. TaxID=1506 RepID=UPI0025F9D61B|nr:hypothetical protein [Clostridium sp.]MDY6227647.1 hypothetical protein [Clostridium sp.]